MTKELLYIPNSSYVIFSITGKLLGSLGEFEKKWNMTSEKIIQHIIANDFHTSFYERNQLPAVYQLDINHFEVINK